MRACHPISVLLLAVAVAVSSFATQHWIVVRNPNFEMFTTDDSRQATRALQTFEQVRYFFLRNSARQQAPEGRVRIIAFSSEKEYKAYRASDAAFAYYLPARERDLIVMQDLQAQHLPVAMHEYTHLIVKHSNMQLPVWLNEGLADLYSSLEPLGDRALVGRPSPGRLASLLGQRWMDWNTLLAVGAGSPYYNERNKASIFYAQSWALTHMLALGAGYSVVFPKLVAAVNGGMDSAQALQSVYGKSVPEIGRDVERYTHQATVKGAIFNVTLPKSASETQVADLSPFQSELALAELLASKRGDEAEAKRRLTELEAQGTNDPEVEESLGYLAWRQNNIEETQKDFRLAVQHGSKNINMLLDLADFESRSDPKSAIELVQKVLILDGENVDARLRLAALQLNDNQYSAALAALTAIHKIKPDQAYRYFLIAAYCHANLNNLANARTSADKASGYAKTLEERGQVQSLVRQLDAAATAKSSGQTARASVEAAAPISPAATGKPLPMHVDFPAERGFRRVSGRTVALECAGNNHLLHLESAGHEMKFDLGDPKSIIVEGRKNLEWNCGALAGETITVVYHAKPGLRSDGLVDSLIF